MTVMDIKPELLRVLDALPQFRQAEVLDFARFLHQQMVAGEPAEMGPPQQIEVHRVPPTTLVGLTGLVALGGDAVADTEALYDNDGRD